ncbi:membrane-bound lytic murein transglycosylase D [Flexibacter flexilis DSM 6793]|uniref:Membrane-bound lytic murein transglycosylase D n=1 Tax=Flexibacter flexilis DSM 6793 TaxID=927664 RepID=A0A1I1MW58_9BACT|nr:LysM peptidoglycan-binding domain-containing protein [Flexibacter flexilis]SFC89647.1 membrane-bound lytic murein transglycosylase D [Flexibacter flexilis DSM 6793]
MKKITIVLVLLFFGKILASHAQETVTTPEQMQFAGIELKISEKVRASIDENVQSLMKNNKYFRQKVERADAYFHIIEKVFAEENIPDDIKYLVLQESGLISDAVSTSNAVGFWQFKKATGIEMGLRIDDDVDERMNIVASSHAAAKYFKRHNFYMKNWIYAVLSHYAGLGGAKSVADPQYMGADKMELDEKTHWYVIKYLSHKVAFESVIHRTPVLPLKVLEYDDCEGKTLEQIAQETNIELEQIRFYNKWLKADKVPTDKDYVVLLPVKSDQETGLMAMINKPVVGESENIKPWKEKTGLFGWGKSKSSSEPKTDAKTGEYVSEAPIFFSWNGIKAIQARKGDNINKLALQSDISKEDFLEYNDLRNFDLIVSGQVYYIRKKHKRAKVPFHTVKDGETLWEISQNYGITMQSLLKKNRMDKPELLKAGRVLWLRRTRPESTPIEYEEVPPAPPIFPLPKKEKTDSVPQQQSQQKPKSNTALAQNKTKQNTASEPVSDKIEFVLPMDSVRAARQAALADSMLKADELQEQAAENSLDSIKIFVAGGEKLPTKKPSKEDIEELNEPVQEPTPTPEKPKSTPNSKTEPTKPATLPKTESKPVVEEMVEAVPFKVHNIEAGQTLYKVSKLYGVRVDSIVAWNNLDGTPLKLGQALKIRTDKDIVSTAPVSTPEPAPAKEKTPTPKTETIEVVVPKTKPTTPPTTTKSTVNQNNTATESVKYYTVKSGDTLYKIARENSVTVGQLKEWNNKADFSVSLGEKLVVKK